ncbi:MFS transporter [Cohnella zeiphila]|uniref:MFS transporter n=1 Tax=Cohnella zeiphila TaxID=2761120 RepID=A0A7X0SNH9_9BACL|nr:MFS transporter [Cohnella zeiphila]MBB6733242.1 MFS transporter [Cohnella zeiphila]
MNARIVLLAVASFVVGTVELVIAGILNLIATDLNVSLGAAGQLVSVYSLIFALGSPILLALTARWERKKLLLAAMSLFVVGCVVSMLAPNFTVLLLSRVLLAASCSVVVVLSVTMAAHLAAPETKGRAIGIIFMGISASLVLGVPLGTFVGERAGWRMTFALIAGLTLTVLLVLAKALPKLESESAEPLRRQLRTLRTPKIWSAHLISVLQMTGQFAIYAYISPFLKTTMNLSTQTISLVLLVYGAAGVAGGWIGGWASDRLGARRTILIALMLHAAAIFLLPVASASMPSLLAAVILWCAFNMAPSPAIQSYLLASSPGSAGVQLSFNTSALHIGVALGSAIGGLIVNRYAVTLNAWAGGGIVLLAIGSALFSMYASKETKFEEINREPA